MCGQEEGGIKDDLDMPGVGHWVDASAISR